MLKTAQKRTATYNIAREFTISIFYWIAGGTLYALSINTFLAPNGVLLGGFTGAATILNYLFNAPIGATVFILNIPLFVVAYKKFGFGFIIRTMIATFLTSFIIDYTAQFFPIYMGDKLLSSLFGAVTGGAGLALVLLRNATTGGVDIIAKLLRLKFPHISMGRVILFMDFIVITASYFVYRSVENLLYSVIVIYISSKAIDYILYGTGAGKMMFIVTDKYKEITDIITNELKRGVSVIDIQGGFTGKQKKMLFCAVKTQEVARFASAVKALDSDSFMVIADAGEILGEGFARRST